MNHQEDLFCKACAFHEAGHAIAAIAIGNCLISAKLEHRDGCVGSVRSFGAIDLDPSSLSCRQEIAKRIFVALSGQAAEKVFWSQIPPEHKPIFISSRASDINFAKSCADLIVDSSHEVDFIIQILANECWNFFLQPGHLAALIKVADALHAELELDEIQIREMVGPIRSFDPLTF